MRKPDPSRAAPILLAAFLAVSIGCAQQNESAADAASTMSEPAQSADAARAAPVAAAEESAAAGAGVQQPGVSAGQLASSAVTATDPRRRFVRTAEARFQVKDVYAATLAIEDAVAAEGGFVVSNAISSSEHGRTERPVGEGKRLQLSQVTMAGTLVVRVPSERTQAFLRVLARHMEFLDSRGFEARDVQFDLLRRELAHARAQLLQRDVQQAADQPARTGEKVDAVHARADMLAARDEALVAQRELEDRVAFSTLTLELRQPVQVREQVVPDIEAILRDRGPGFFSRIGEALASGWRGLLDALVVAVHLWPLWLLLAGAAALWRALRRGRGRVAAAPGAHA